MFLKSISSFLLILGFGLSLYGQKPKEKKSDDKIEEIELQHADRFTRDKSTPSGASKLIGNVSFTHKNAIMYCDSAYLFENNSMKAYGHVKIVDGDSLTMKGDSLFYDGNTQIAKVRGNVIIDNKSSILKTPFLDYNRVTGASDYYGGGVIDSRKEKIHLVSDRGRYFSDSKIFHFKKDVVMTHPDYLIETDTMHYAPNIEKTWFFGPTDITFDDRDIYCELGWFDQLKDKAVFINKAKINSSGQTLKGDTIIYDQASKIGISKCNVIIIDTNEKFEVHGDYGFFNEVDSSSIVTINMLMKQDMDGDTFFLTGDTMRSTLDTNHHRIIKTYNNSRFYKSDMQGQCDSLVYLTRDSIIHLFQKPILWSDGSQITSDSLYLTMKNSVLDKMYMNGNSFIISEDDSVFYNQIKGDRMIGYFKESQLHKVDVFSNGKTIYYPREDDGFMIGMNKTECTNMTIRIDSSKINSISFYDKPTALLTPTEDMPIGGLKLDGFAYYPELRPTSLNNLLGFQDPVKSNDSLAKITLIDSHSADRDTLIHISVDTSQTRVDKGSKLSKGGNRPMSKENNKKEPSEKNSDRAEKREKATKD